MAITGQPEQRTSLRVDPSQFVGNNQPVVEPRGVAALSDAFRQGWVSADDIADRAMTLEARKAASNPEIVKAKQTAQELENAMKRQQIEGTRMQLNKQAALSKIPSTVLDVNEQILNKAGWKVMTPAELWSPADTKEVLDRWETVQDWEKNVSRAEAEKSIVSAGPAGGVFNVNAQEAVNPDRVKETQLWKARNTSPQEFARQGKAPYPSLLESITPGTAQVAPAAAAPAAVPAAPAAVPAAPAAVPYGAATTGPEGFRQLNLAKPGDSQPKSATEAQVKAANFVARSISADQVFKNLDAAGFNPGSFGNWAQELLLGPLEALRTTDRRAFDAAKDSWSQGLLRLESGAAISAKEQSWYARTFFPTGLEPKVVQDQKMQMRADVEKIAAEVARSGSLDVPALLAVRQQAEMLDSLQSKGAFASGAGAGGKQLEVPGVGKVTYFVDEQGNQRVILGQSKTVQPKVLPSPALKPTPRNQ